VHGEPRGGDEAWEPSADALPQFQRLSAHIAAQEGGCPAGSLHDELDRFLYQRGFWREGIWQAALLTAQDAAGRLVPDMPDNVDLQDPEQMFACGAAWGIIDGLRTAMALMRAEPEELAKR
jgi:hypothetical protein